MRLKNKLAIITGASRGIGKATALLFAKEGAIVVINYAQSEKDARHVLDEIKKLGSDGMIFKCDVSKEDEVKLMIEQTVEKYGKIDILINNAGIVIDTPFLERTVEQWKRTLEVNLIGTFLCSKYASIEMLKNGGGNIVNVASTNGINNFSSYSMDYDSSKAGVLLLTKNLAKELAPTIRVNAVAPGWVDTDMNKNLPKQLLDQEMKSTYLGRLATADEIATTIVFLASDDASYITGSTLIVDGGHI